MSDQEIKKTRDENKEAQEEVKDNNAPYQCKKCGDKVNFHFILKFIKDSGLCPNCFHE